MSEHTIEFKPRDATVNIIHDIDYELFEMAEDPFYISSAHLFSECHEVRAKLNSASLITVMDESGDGLAKFFHRDKIWTLEYNNKVATSECFRDDLKAMMMEVGLRNKVFLDLFRDPMTVAMEVYGKDLAHTPIPYTNARRLEGLSKHIEVLDAESKHAYIVIDDEVITIVHPIGDGWFSHNFLSSETSYFDNVEDAFKKAKLSDTLGKLVKRDYT